MADPFNVYHVNSPITLVHGYDNNEQPHNFVIDVDSRVIKSYGMDPPSRLTLWSLDKADLENTQIAIGKKFVEIDLDVSNANILHPYTASEFHTISPIILAQSMLYQSQLHDQYQKECELATMSTSYRYGRINTLFGTLPSKEKSSDFDEEERVILLKALNGIQKINHKRILEIPSPPTLGDIIYSMLVNNES